MAGFGEYESAVIWQEEQGFKQSKLRQWIEVIESRGDGGEFSEFGGWLRIIQQQDASSFWNQTAEESKQRVMEVYGLLAEERKMVPGMFGIG